MNRTNFIVETHSSFVSWRFCYIAAVLLMSGLGSMSPGNPAYSQAPIAGNTPGVRKPAPDAAQLKAVQLKIQEVYGVEIQNASKPADKELLAAKLLKMADESRDDPSTYYALLNSVRDLSIGAGNYSQSISMTNKLTEAFELDTSEEQYLVLKKCGESFAATAPGLLDVANASFQMATGFSKQGNSEQALRFSRIAHAAATKARSGPLLKQITAFGTEQAARETERQALPAAEAKLAADPADPAANMTLGRWHWFRMDDPTKAMPYLAKTAESPLQKAALAELAKPATPGAQVDLADQWWALAQVVKEDALKNRILARAGDWYQTAFPESKGIDKIKAERRLAEIQTQLGPRAIVSAGLPATPGNMVPKTFKTSLGAEMIFIHAGKFVMGSPDNEAGRKPIEKQVSVEITKGFYLGKYEVTQGEWRALMGTEPWKENGKPLDFVTEGEDMVAVYIRHGWGAQGQIEPDTAMAFCKQLSLREKKNYRLPTEAEWEYACRAGTTTDYSFGTDPNEYRDYAWTYKNTKNRIQQVGTKKPNPWGLHDMHGNAQEWCLDAFSNQQPNLLGGRDPLATVLDPGKYRICRGGSYANDNMYSRSAYRAWDSYDSNGCTHGFRLVLEAASVKPSSSTTPAATTAPAATPIVTAPTLPALPTSSQLATGDLPKTVKTSLDAELILIPSGKFLMGSPENEADRQPHEKQVAVEITQPFYMGKCEVTQGEWKALMGTTPWLDKNTKKAKEYVKEGDDIVAVCIMQGMNNRGQIEPDSAAAFCKKLSQKEGRNYRLPTEAEWEYACRAGSQTAYFFGDSANDLRDYAWNIKNAKWSIHQVGALKPNAWGLHDMLGNASEWCLDSYDYQRPQLLGGRNPLGTLLNDRQSRICRGSSFGASVNWVYRSAYRSNISYQEARVDNGFRLVLEAASVKPSTTTIAPAQPTLTPTLTPTTPALPTPVATAPANSTPVVTTPTRPTPTLPTPTLPTSSQPATGNLSKTMKTSLGAELIFIPAGKFLMGSPENEPKRKTWENQVSVEITRGFYLGKHEVTQREWRELMGTEPWLNKKTNDPHENVIVGDDIVAVHIMHGVGSDGQIKADSAMAFCKKLSEKEGRTYRLPTEAEWEYACRAGSQTPYYFGSDASELSDYAWCAKNSKFRIQQVGLKKPNAWGLHDMLGNAQEWCMDFYNNEKTQLPGGSDPLETTSSSLQFRILRGGNFAGMDEALFRSGSRGWANYNVKRNNDGFRLVLEAVATKPGAASSMP